MTSPALIAQLRELCRLAQQAGADPVWLRETADNLVALILAEPRDPRRRRSLARAATLASAVKSMQCAGHEHGPSVTAVRARYGLSKSRAYALLQLSRDIAGPNRS